MIRYTMGRHVYKAIVFATALALLAAAPVAAETAAQKAAVALVSLERSRGNTDVEEPVCFTIQAYAQCSFELGNGNAEEWRLLQLKNGVWTRLGGGGEVTADQGIAKFGSIASMFEKQYGVPASVANQLAKEMNLPAAFSDWKRIDFKERGDLGAVVEMYPILRDPIEKARRDYERQPSNLRTTPLRVQVAFARSKENDLDLLFLYVQDPLYCGSHGCSMFVYADEGDGYKVAEDTLVAFPDVYLSSEGSPVLLFCGSLQGGGTWVFSHHALVSSGSGNKCPKTAPHS